MPRHKRRGGAKADADPPPSVDFPADVRAESCRRAEALIQLTSSAGPATALFPDLAAAVRDLEELQARWAVRGGSAPEERLAAAQRLLEWAGERGVDCSALEPADFAGQGLGLRARRRLERLDAVLEVPRDLILTTEEAFSSPIGDFLRADPVCAGVSSMALAVFLLHEAARGEDSQWAPYIAALPDAYSNCLYFSAEELRLLRGSPTQERVATEFRRICRQYAFFLLQMDRSREAGALAFRGHFAFADFRWAVATVMSRNNPVPLAAEVGCSLGLIPLWDLGNHKVGEMTTDFDPDRRLLRFHAMEDTPEGEQVLFHYGNRSNADLLVYAGFAVDANPFDRFPVRLGVSSKDALCAQRLGLLSRLGLEGTETFFLTDSEPLPQSMVAFSRIFVMDEEELDRRADADVGALSAAVLAPGLGQAGADGRAASFLRGRCHLLLSALSAPRDEVAGSPVAPHVARLLAGEAALLRRAVALADEGAAAAAAAEGDG